MRKPTEDPRRVGEARSSGTWAGGKTADPTREANPTRLPQALAHPLAASPADILGLQRTLGNRATSRLLAGAKQNPSAPAGGGTGVVQAKSRVDGTSRGNQTGMPDTLKAGVEALSGESMDDVRVHYNSAEPSKVNASAYARGTEIHLGRGQERHLPHEAWHVVQQKQGRVDITHQMKGIAINKDTTLEREADAMGARAAIRGTMPSPSREADPSPVEGRETDGPQATRPIQAVAAGRMQPQGVIQRADEHVLAEGATAIAAQGDTIRYTRLAGGCIAVTAFFRGGGGAGVHLAMGMDNEAQWNGFAALVEGQTITAVKLDSDDFDDDQGWRVSFQGVRAASWPRSSLALHEDFALAIDDMAAHGWLYGRANIVRWFGAKLGTANVAARVEQNPSWVIP
jgi:hypothetical protein